MTPEAALLKLIADLYTQNAALQRRVAELEAEKTPDAAAQH
jgi:hypothetical protein